MKPKKTMIIPPSVNQNCGVSKKIHTLSTDTAGVFKYSHGRVSLFPIQKSREILP